MPSRRRSRRATDHIRARGPLVLTAGTDRGARDETVAAGRPAGHDRAAIGERVAAELAEAARAIVSEAPVWGLVPSGGETTAAVLDAFEARMLSLPGHSVEGGVPVGTITGGHADGLPVATAARAFGDDETLVACLAAVETDRQRVAVTMADLAGIGPGAILDGLPALHEHAGAVAVGDAHVLRTAARTSDLDVDVHAVQTVADATDAAGVAPVLDLDNRGPQLAVVDEAFGRAGLEYIERAIELAVEETVDAIATALIKKRALRQPGGVQADHTKLLADRTGTQDYPMLLVEDLLRVAHVSTQVKVGEACDLLTTNRVTRTIELTADDVADLGAANPSIAVAGLNPTPARRAMLGREDAGEIEPAVERARSAGTDAVWPEPPDTAFSWAARGECDAVVAMYHDQGHLPVKLQRFQSEGTTEINLTLGLPRVRTSVDQVTAFDIAGVCGFLGEHGPGGRRGGATRPATVL